MNTKTKPNFYTKDDPAFAEFFGGLLTYYRYREGGATVNAWQLNRLGGKYEGIPRVFKTSYEDCAEIIKKTSVAELMSCPVVEGEDFTCPTTGQTYETRVYQGWTISGEYIAKMVQQSAADNAAIAKNNTAKKQATAAA
tara:strand:- start:4375 stop:4791 length:417 start_codon:yes stop_codon:yes gene_type:complete